MKNRTVSLCDRCWTGFPTQWDGAGAGGDAGAWTVDRCGGQSIGRVSYLPLYYGGMCRDTNV